jgi:hypothetical protein
MSLFKHGKINDKELDQIRNEVQTYKHKAGAAGLYSKEKSTFDKNVRSGVTYFPSSIDSRRTFNILQSVVIENYFPYKEYMDFTNISSIQYTRYDDGEWFKWHHDIIEMPERDVRRVFTMSLNITPAEEYEGSGLVYYHNKVEYLDKTPGSYAIFPSWVLHQACRVTKGTREAIVVWVEATPKELQNIRELFHKLYGKYEYPKESDIINIT